MYIYIYTALYTINVRITVKFFIFKMNLRKRLQKTNLEIFWPTSLTSVEEEDFWELKTVLSSDEDHKVEAAIRPFLKQLSLTIIKNKPIIPSFLLKLL